MLLVRIGQLLLLSLHLMTKKSFFITFFVISDLRVIVDEALRNIAVDRSEAFWTEDERINALSVEDMRRVAPKLNDLTSFTFELSCKGLLVELRFKLVGLHLKFVKWFLASLTAEVIIVHKILNASNHD